MTRPAARALPLPALGPVLLVGRRGPLPRLLDLLALRRSRRRLGDLGPERLRDLGLSRGEALLESRKPFWDAPDHWLR